ncbi:MAG TPA: tyrosine--tRNA ligase [Actinomycetota bacterium]|nr:tyrosine--tRNA ligase [Actinomycetota bacterium]
MSQSAAEQAAALTQRADVVVRRDELEERLALGRPLRVKLGVDPTARSVTLGWAVPLRKLRDFQDAGHTAVLIVGDFTARIGDPSGKSATRPQLDEATVRANAEACVGQLLDVLSEDNLEIRYNSEWLAPLDLAGLLRLTSHVTVAQMLEREDFATRYEAHRPISLVEFMYPLLQAYDSVAVHADVELGGSDQLFNLLVGRDLQRAHGQRPQIVMTMPLLVGLDGVQKMSQSLGNFVGVRDAPGDMFGKLMSVPDELVGQYASLGAQLDPDDVAALERAAAGGGPDAAGAKRAVARAVVALYHGDDAAGAAEADFDRRFRDREVPQDVAEVALDPELVGDAGVYLPRLLVAAGLAPSATAGRRLVEGRGVRIDGEIVDTPDVDAARVRGAVVQVGRRRAVRVV